MSEVPGVALSHRRDLHWRRPVPQPSRNHRPFHSPPNIARKNPRPLTEKVIPLTVRSARRDQRAHEGAPLPTIGGGGGSAANNWSVTSSASTALSGSPSSTDSTETTSWSPLTVRLSGTTSSRRTQNAIKQEYGWSFYLLLTIRGNDCFKGPSKRRQSAAPSVRGPPLFPSPPQTG